MSRKHRSGHSSRGLSPEAKVRAYFREHAWAIWVVAAVVVLLALGLVVSLSS